MQWLSWLAFAQRTYEAQAAIELEVLSRSYLEGAQAYPFRLADYESDKRMMTDANRGPDYKTSATDFKMDKRMSNTDGGTDYETDKRMSNVDGRTDYETDKRMIIGVRELLATVVADAAKNEAPGLIGARFHKTIAAIAMEVCRNVSERTGIGEIALSGGVWQNQVLLDLVRTGLEKDGFTVYFHKLTPTNDGGIALGQAAVANFQSSNR
jgi:hydrogenase maturation factor HypF (carbamoyltransferase family)